MVPADLLHASSPAAFRSDPVVRFDYCRYSRTESAHCSPPVDPDRACTRTAYNALHLQPSTHGESARKSHCGDSHRHRQLAPPASDTRKKHGGAEQCTRDDLRHRRQRQRRPPKSASDGRPLRRGNTKCSPESGLHPRTESQTASWTVPCSSGTATSWTASPRLRDRCEERRETRRQLVSFGEQNYPHCADLREKLCFCQVALPARDWSWS